MTADRAIERHPAGYDELLVQLKERIRGAQVRAALSVNRELVLLYWSIGRDILARQQEQGWGAKVIERLAGDLRHEFPEMKGFSPRNLKYMRAFAAAWPEEAIVQQVVAQLPWGHNVRLLDYVKDHAERAWYVHVTIENGWSRSILVHQIESGLYHRQGRAITNFERVLPPPQSELAAQILKDPYSFDFLTLAQDAQERDLQRGLLQHLRDFLLELGVGFAFVGSRVHLEVGGEDFYVDLLFYHLRLRCFVVVDLKIGKFEPEFVGKMSFYLSAVDDRLRHPSDQRSVGIILCKTQTRIIAEYALREVAKPMGIATYRLGTSLPEDLRGSLPSVEDLEAELAALGDTASGETASPTP